MKKLYEKYREIILYLVFGVATTIIAWVGYFLILEGLKALLDLSDDDPVLQAVRVVANVISWIAGVLFAFFTNKSYVFGDKNTEARHMWKKLIEFSSSRLLTLILEIVVIYVTVEILLACSYLDIAVNIFGFEFMLTKDIIAKSIAAILVVVSNYILSKLFVFRKKKMDNK